MCALAPWEGATGGRAPGHASVSESNEFQGLTHGARDERCQSALFQIASYRRQRGVYAVNEIGNFEEQPTYHLVLSTWYLLLST